jgi:hypothetical protein
MVAKQEYHWYVERSNSATRAALALAAAGVLLLLAFEQSAVAQINGTPASVTSINFGGRLNSVPGVPASVTSLGPNGVQPKSQFFTQPMCCISPLFPPHPNPPLFPRRHHHRQNSFFPAGGAVYVPYPVPVEPEADDAAVDANPPDDDRGGPTIFDRRGSGQPARLFLDDYPPRPSRARSENRDRPDRESAASAPPDEAPVADQPQTVLIFKDGHQVEVQNYAVVGNMLYDLSPGHHRKIAIADLDLKATAKQNDDLGINFQLPPAPEVNNSEVNK